jgi:uncharacterized membrane protein
MKKQNYGVVKQRLRPFMFVLISIVVIATGILFWLNAYRKGDVVGGFLGFLIALTILGLAIFVFSKGSRDLREGYPLEDERSTTVKEKASSRAFYVSLYLLLLVGLLSDNVIVFRDVSQAMSATVGGMAVLFVAFWLYYSRKEL